MLAGCCKTEFPQGNTLIGNWSVTEIYWSRDVMGLFPYVSDTLEGTGYINLNKDSTGTMLFDETRIIGDEVAHFTWSHDKLRNYVFFNFNDESKKRSRIYSYNSDTLKLYLWDQGTTGAGLYFYLIMVKIQDE